MIIFNKEKKQVSIRKICNFAVNIGIIVIKSKETRGGGSPTPTDILVAI